MKKSLIILAALALIGAATVRAEEASPSTKPAHPAGGPGGPRMHMEGLLPPNMAEQLALTDAQKTTLAELDKQYAKDRADLHKKFMDQFKALLTDEQKQKLEKMRENRPGTGRGPRGAHGPNTAPPPEPKN